MSYCDQHHFPLPAGHKFPLEKYRLVRSALQPDGRFAFHSADLATRDSIDRVHDPDYVSRFLEGTLNSGVMRRIGFPWSPELVRRTLASVGSTLQASHHALASGVGGTLAGGTHHAYRSEGSGFCVFNDLAVSIAAIRAETGLRRIAIVDLDVHQGDGTAAIFSGDPTVFTLSLHGARNFPLRKQTSVLDVELNDGTSDDEYIALLEPALDRVWAFHPQAVFFQSGVDGLETDRLGRLSLTRPGLSRRDHLVIGGALGRQVPLVITMGGGYSNPVEHTVAAHAQTFRIAADLFCGNSRQREVESPQPSSAPDLKVNQEPIT